MIIAHGVDLVDVSSTARLLADPSGQFLTRCFTDHEQTSAGGGADRSARLSGRFAIKEAVMKALGTGFGEGVGFLDIETITLASGAPSIALHGEARRRAELLGISSWLVSTSHEGTMAIASVIGLAVQRTPDN